ncbi:MAG: amidoligase family protein [Campylobacterales bacterium]
MTDFLYPPTVRCANGEMRRVGFELEYSGPRLDVCARIVADITGGSIEEVNPWYFTVGGTQWGDFSLTLDYQFLIRSGLKEWLHDAGFDGAMEQDEIEALEYFIGSFSASLVPYELTTPPLPLDEMDLIETLKNALRDAGALGTAANPLYVFGFHINPEIPRTDVQTVLAYLRAYLLLYDLLAEEIRPVFTRRLSFYIDPFPSDYVRHVLHPAYREKINPRPTFHFRMPNSRVDEPAWHTSDPWNSWVLVERLANDAETLLSLSYERYRMMRSLFYRFKKKHWIKRIRRWAETSA